MGDGRRRRDCRAGPYRPIGLVAGNHGDFWIGGGSWAQIYHQRVQTSLEQATVAASANSDHNALRLLNTQYANLARWESVVVAERANHNGKRTVAENSLQNDPVLIKFSNYGDS